MSSWMQPSVNIWLVLLQRILTATAIRFIPKLLFARRKLTKKASPGGIFLLYKDMKNAVMSSLAGLGFGLSLLGSVAAGFSLPSFVFAAFDILPCPDGER